MWQIVFTGIIVAAALFFAVRPLFRKKKSSIDDCNTCSSACEGCPVMEIKKKMKDPQDKRSDRKLTR